MYLRIDTTLNFKYIRYLLKNTLYFCKREILQHREKKVLPLCIIFSEGMCWLSRNSEKEVRKFGTSKDPLYPSLPFESCSGIERKTLIKSW